MKNTASIVTGFAVMGLIMVAGAYLLPWKNISWGKVEWTPSSLVTVSGQAKSQEANQIASFSAGVNAVNDNKDEAIKEVNQKMETIIEEVKKFGVDQKDIQTQNLSVYQDEQRYWDGGVEKSKKGQWRVGNNIEITLRQIEKATDLASILTNSGANNVYGPNFRMEDTSEAEKSLFDAAMTDAKEKAEIVAKASGRNLGKVINVSEGAISSGIYPMYKMEGAGGGGAPIEPGSATVSKTITVVFELN